MQFAEVLVDVPTMQTDHPFTYQIPEPLIDQITMGMRVIVPFGRGGRKVQGIVLGLTDHVNFKGQVKPILSIMDLSPVVNPELMQLSDWLAKTTFSFRINCLWTMLPALMKSKTEKVIVPVQNNASVEDFFKGQSQLLLDEVQKNPHDLSKLLELKSQHLIKINYSIDNRAKDKTVISVRAALAPNKLKQALKQVRSNAQAQTDLLHWLIDHPDLTVAHHELTKVGKITSSTLKTAEQKGWVAFGELKIRRNPYDRPIKKNYPLKLNQDQNNAVHSIDEAIEASQAKVFLLEGVTGSGKTEVYLQTIQKALVQGKTALMLVPEIALTPQIVQRVKGRFGDNVAMLHSGLSQGERYDEWQRISDGKAQVVVGARSAVFAPLSNIGVIIMDEEHDDSYKQEDTPRYSTREVAKQRGKYHQCPVVLGSATPALESRARAGKGVYQLLMMPERINHQALPTVQIVDMRNEMMKRAESNFSQSLLNAIQKRINRKEQVVLMLNRRGYSAFVMCRDCGFVLKCPNCDISLTLHLDQHLMKCHYCGHEEPIPQVCPNCHGHDIRYFGTGTQKVQAELARIMPKARVLRMDVDTTRRKGAHEKILRQFGQHQADILLGTQMVAKGLDFPDITLVGVLNADTSLELPDFRASERTFQLLTQVSGRAGRAEKKGEVYVQTFNPDNYAIQLAQKQDYERFYLEEMRIRHMTNYPPYFFTVRITTNAKFERAAAHQMYEIKNYLQAHLSSQTMILGPTPGAIARLKNKYYYQILLKYKYEPELAENLEYILNHYQSLNRKGIYVSIDPDPVSFM